MMITRLAMLLVFMLVTIDSAQTNNYPWLEEQKNTRSIASEILPPQGFERVKEEPGSFGNWLRHLPLKREGTPVYLHDGSEKPNQEAHFAVVDIDIGSQDLQQCADAIIRLRAEYLYSTKQYAAIHFSFTSGDEASFSKWTFGFRPIVKGNKVTWSKSTREDSSYAGFMKYLAMVFLYAGSNSLSQEMEARTDLREMEIGDVFIEGGFPGHAVIVVDMAYNDSTGEKVFLLAQSYMPAQDIHVLRNPADKELSPWYKLDFGSELTTPEWSFKKKHLKFFKSE